jgi:hypothetical protein
MGLRKAACRASQSLPGDFFQTMLFCFGFAAWRGITVGAALAEMMAALPQPMRRIMQFQFDIATTNATPAAPPQQPPAAESVPEILRQMLELQREQFNQLVELQREQLAQARAAAQDSMARWRNLLARWQKDFPEFAGQCKQAYPLLERAYVLILNGMVVELADQGDEALDNDFTVQEFLDRYGMRLGQLSHLLSVIGPLAEATNQGESK